jgi:hypothetical protein
MDGIDKVFGLVLGPSELALQGFVLALEIHDALLGADVVA